MKLPQAVHWVILVVAGVLFGWLYECPVWAQQTSAYRIETVATPPDDVAEEIASALQRQGLRLVRENSEIVAELWLRSTLPLKTSAAGYDALEEGTLVGVLNFPKGGSDFRGQPIQPGVYTLRFEHIPEDGYHMGAAPELYFLLLIRAKADRDLKASLDFNHVMALSRQASGTNHPAPLMLLPATTQTNFPEVQTNELGHVALRTKTLAQIPGSDKAQDFPLALVLVGRAEL
ncbi:MAG: hypothetical protein HY313_06515 [Acidobacteria bacterium]|nr:hypothetical protein [Acidobacteriota bacterium]